MANAKHLRILKQGVKEWNQWRERHDKVSSALNNPYVQLTRIIVRPVLFPIEPALTLITPISFDLSGADLRHLYLSGANLSGTNLSEANLSSADLSSANLSEANLSSADLSSANLSEANLSSADLSSANLSGANLGGIDLSGFDLSGFDLRRVNLSRANLSKTQFLRTNFEKAILTAACLEDWNINSATRFEGATGEYVYLKANQQERRPREGTFKPGEFAALFQQTFDTIDLIFKGGIDWQAFFQSFQDLRCQYADQDLAIQAIEKKRGGAFIVRVEVAEDADKSAIEGSAKELYGTKLTLLEQRYRAELQAKDGEIFAYREQSANLMKITEMLAARPPMSDAPKYDMRGAQFAGGFAETVQGNQVGGTINNEAAETLSLAAAAAEIQSLLKQLEASNPSPTQAQQTAYLDAMISPTKRERFIGALKAASGAAIEEVPYGAVLKALVEGWQRPNG
ncbi:MAG: pentapeptide repeat-containing protein [Cyanobacteria bacterium P01_F01_bin.86]